LPEQYGIGSGLFVDVGTVGLLDDEDRITVRDGLNGITLIPEDAAALRISAGLSLYWDSPFGPLRFDFSNIVRQKYYDRTETFRFGARTQF
jgi:outer membrane protein insertion porin family